MKKKALWTVLIGLIFSSLLFSGCATTIHLDKSDLTSLAPLTVVSYIIPYYGVQVRHDGGETAGIVVGVVSLVGGIGINSAVDAWEGALEDEIAAARVPRYNELVMKKFVERASKELPGWPPMVVDEYPVSRNYLKKFFKNKSGSILLLIPEHESAPILSTAHGFKSNYRAEIYDSEAHLVWWKDFVYSSRKYGRHRSIEEYKVDNFKFLKEEMEFAAEATVSAFIDSILQETGLPRISAQTEREQKDLSLEELSQEQTQLEEMSGDYGIISITSEPPGAKIFIDREFKGQTPAEMSLTTGTYQLFLEHQLYEPYMDSLTIEQGQTETLNIRLSPEGKEQK